MSTVAYFVNQKTKKRYRVLGLDGDTNQVRLKGPNSEFSVSYDKEQFKKMGYSMVREEEPDEPEEEE